VSAKRCSWTILLLVEEIGLFILEEDVYSQPLTLIYHLKFAMAIIELVVGGRWQRFLRWEESRWRLHKRVESQGKYNWK